MVEVIAISLVALIKPSDKKVVMRRWDIPVGDCGNSLPIDTFDLMPMLEWAHQ